MRERAPLVARWVERMRAPEPRTGAFLDQDEVPATLEPIVARMIREFVPVLASTQRALAELAARTDATDAALARAIGTHTFRLGQSVSERAIYPFNLWRWQRAADQFQALDAAARQRARALLAAHGGEWLTQPASPRLTRKQNKLFLAPRRD